jgi:hypothetical protein
MCLLVLEKIWIQFTSIIKLCSISNFFRTHPPTTLHNPKGIKFFDLFGWKRIAILIQTEEVWQSTAEHLETLAHKHNVHVRKLKYI